MLYQRYNVIRRPLLVWIHIEWHLAPLRHRLWQVAFCLIEGTENTHLATLLPKYLDSVLGAAQHVHRRAVPERWPFLPTPTPVFAASTGISRQGACGLDQACHPSYLLYPVIACTIS